jgi:hypothetical protein
MKNICSRRNVRAGLYAVFLFLFSGSVIAQTVDGVLEDAKILKDGMNIYMSGFDKGNVLYKRAETPVLTDFKHLGDSVLFMVKGDDEEVLIYQIALNPLKYNYEDTTLFYTDPIDAKANEALGTILSALTKATQEQNIANQAKFQAANPKMILPVGFIAPSDVTASCSFAEIKAKFIKAQTALNEDWKGTINAQFSALEAIDFQSAANLKNEAIKVEAQYTKIKSDLNTNDQAISDFEQAIKELNSNCKEVDRHWLDDYTLGLMLKDMQSVQKQHKLRLSNLKKAIDIVMAMVNVTVASNSYAFVKTSATMLQKGKITSKSLTCYESGLMLDASGEIVVRPKKKVTTRTILLRRFHRFVPEVLAGIAYTGLNFPQYGTTTDSAGKLHVANAGEESVKRYAFNVMVNFNYYIPSSQVHPFYQIGIGTNLQNPVLLSGVGIRTRVSGKFGFTLSCGAALGLIKDLKTLKVGQEVTGTAEIEQDYKFNFDINNIKPYVGIQVAL